MSRVLVITNNLEQASYRLRIEALVTPLSAMGHALTIEVRPRRVLARRALLRQAQRFDSVILQRKLLDPSDARLLRRYARRLYFDVDDAVMYHNAPTGWISRWRTHRRYIATARAADCVVAGNQYLARLFAEQGAATRVLPTVVDIGRYQVKQHLATPEPTLVWIGSKSTLPYLEQAANALKLAREVSPGLRLMIVADQGWDNAPLPVEWVPWSAEREISALAMADIGIAPTPTDRWTLGKCGFKIVQYLAAGLPVIASPVGANAQIVLPEENGLLPETDQQWADAIPRLVRDVALRARWGSAARQRAVEHYSLERAAAFWHALLSESASDASLNVQDS